MRRPGIHSQRPAGSNFKRPDCPEFDVKHRRSILQLCRCIERLPNPRDHGSRKAPLTSLIDHPIALFGVLFATLLVVVEIGCRVAPRTSVDGNEGLHEEIVAARDGIGVLLSLLLAFTLGMVLTRYDSRKQLIVDEANAIGTTRLRAQMLAEPFRTKILALLRMYLDARINFSEAGLDGEKSKASFSQAKELLDEMWQQSVAVTQQSPTPITSIFVQSLNETTDLSERRLAALENRIPGVLWVVLIFMSTLTCLLVGFSLRRKALLVILVWPLMISIVLALNADLDSPRTGLIQIGQQSIERLR
jgi:hypothetical protein